MPKNSNRDFLEFHGLPPDVILSIIDRAQFLATAWTDRTMPQSLFGKRVALIADDSGWRNTTAFDLGVQALGGICVTSPISFNLREPTADLAQYLDNWFDILVVRTKELSMLKDLASCAKAPVINARTKSNHPCETLGDLAYIQSKRGTLEGLKIAVVAPDANILRSWVEASISLPIQVKQVYPENWHVRDVSLLNPNFAASTDLSEMSNADIIVTDCWPSGASEHHMLRYQISASMLETCRRDVIFLPCPPVARGQEVTVDAMSHPACQSGVAKAYLLHAQNALLEWVAA
ncbi:ornithine carbamoyltransferase [Rhizobium sp. BK313]|uniref:ornithine carbamoyltransferase n=1 Tax=Rhizobium sp. BK313 TaxID=2587081 RepID=UPI00105C52FB|nr:ornithine carbamoyltransferase [Rhizobium sp. BK313]MBB3452579.1 ornithine carbamoyltransferase [Rhizobium sp. BK313]